MSSDLFNLLWRLVHAGVDFVIVGGFAGVVSWLTYLAFWGGSDRRVNPLVALLLMVLAPLA